MFIQLEYVSKFIKDNKINNKNFIVSCRFKEVDKENIESDILDWYSQHLENTDYIMNDYLLSRIKKLITSSNREEILEIVIDSKEKYSEIVFIISK